MNKFCQKSKIFKKHMHLAILCDLFWDGENVTLPKFVGDQRLTFGDRSFGHGSRLNHLAIIVSL